MYIRHIYMTFTLFAFLSMHVYLTSIKKGTTKRLATPCFVQWTIICYSQQPSTSIPTCTTPDSLSQNKSIQYCSFSWWLTLKYRPWCLAALSWTTAGLLIVTTSRSIIYSGLKQNKPGAQFKDFLFNTD